jgi:hypothetical protein
MNSDNAHIMSLYSATRAYWLLKKTLAASPQNSKHKGLLNSALVGFCFAQQSRFSEMAEEQGVAAQLPLDGPNSDVADVEFQVSCVNY